MRRLAVCATAAAILGLGAAAPARADFHGLCTGGASALPGLTSDGTAFTFSATVNCGGADALLIQNLSLANAFSPMLGSWTAPNVVCGPCSTLSTSGSAPVAPGVYNVTFSFSAAKAGAQAHPHRASRWVWVGVGQPQSQCRRDAPPNAAGC